MKPIMIQNGHALSEVHRDGHDPYTSTLQAQCSCGWEGAAIGAYEDFQCSAVRSQGLAHLAQVERERRQAAALKVLGIA